MTTALSFKRPFAHSVGLSFHPQRWKGLVSLFATGLGETSELRDLSPYKNHGALINMGASNWGTSSDSRTPGPVLNYDGVNQYVNIGDFPQQPTRDISIVQWIQFDTLVAGRFFCSKMNSDFDDGWAVQYNETRVHFYINSGQTNFRTVHGLSAGDQFHFALTKAFTDDFGKMYIDGKEVFAQPQTAGPNQAPNSTGPFEIGAKSIGVGAKFHDGQIPYTAVYNRILSPRDMADDFQDYLALMRRRRRSLRPPVAVVGAFKPFFRQGRSVTP